MRSIARARVSTSGREQLHELARHAVVVRHRDDRKGELVNVGVGARQPAVPRQRGRQQIVRRQDRLRGDLAENLGRFDHFAQMQPHQVAVDSARTVGRRQQKWAEEHPQRVFDRKVGIVEVAECRRHRGDRSQQHRPVQTFLVAEVVVNRRDVLAGGVADLARRRRREPLGRKDPRGVRHQLLAGELALVGATLRLGGSRGNDGSVALQGGRHAADFSINQALD